MIKNNVFERFLGFATKFINFTCLFHSILLLFFKNAAFINFNLNASLLLCFKVLIVVEKKTVDFVLKITF